MVYTRKHDCQHLVKKSCNPGVLTAEASGEIQDRSVDGFFRVSPQAGLDWG